MKKLVLVALLLCLLLVLTGCGCKHEETQLINVVEATCTEVGYSGDTYCPKCEKTIAQGEEVAAKGHTAGELANVVEATCVEEGYSGDVPCVDCGEILETGEVIPMVEHIASEERMYAAEATCEYYGYTGDSYCAVCGMLLGYGEDIPKLDHVPETERSNASEATCTEWGYTGNIRCVNCGEMLEIGEDIPMLDHTYGEPVGVIVPTCTEEGFGGNRTCSVCGYEEVGETLPRNGHTFENNICIICSEPEPGLYIEGQKAFTWQQLVDTGYVAVNGIKITDIAEPLYGDLVIDDTIQYMDKNISGLQLNSIYAGGIISASYNCLNDCPNLESICLPKIKVADYGFIVNCPSLKSVDIGNYTGRLSMYAFNDSASLKSINLPDTIDCIGQDAFQNCTSLQEVKLPAGLKTLYDACFTDCPALTSIDLPEGLERIDNWCFRRTGIEEFILPSTVTALGWMKGSTFVHVDLSKTRLTMLNTFADSMNLETIDFPLTLERVSADAFANCPKLQRFEFPEGFSVLEGRKDSLTKCESLTTVVWPASLIDGTNLASAPNLTEILYMGNELQWSMTASKDMFPNATITFNYQPE